MPFAGYADFEECVRKNSDKSDPQAYCGKIKHAVEAIEMAGKKGPPTLQDIPASHIFYEDTEPIVALEETSDGRMMATIRIIKAGVSKNNRNYRPEALKQAAKEGIFNGVRMFVNHDRKKKNLDRGMGELVSAIESTEYDEANQSLNGKVEFFDKNFYDYANRAKRYIGPSIDSILRGVRIPQPGGRALEDIYGFQTVNSVDWVVYPAAGGAILAMESEEEDEDMGALDFKALEADLGALSEEDIKANLPSLWKKFHPETSGQPPVHGHAQEGETEVVSKDEIEEIVKQRLTAYENEKTELARKQASAAEQVKAAFAASGLPEPVRGRVMRGFEGVEAFDEAAVKQAITDAQEELKALKVGPQIKDMGPGNSAGDAGGTDTKLHAHEGVMAHFGVAADKGKNSDESEEGK
jgi:hypothetical protein